MVTPLIELSLPGVPLRLARKREGQSAMNRLLFLFLFLVSPSTSERIKCELATNGTDSKDDRCASICCPENDSGRSETNVQFSNEFEPRFDQMFALRIIGGACVTQQEITEAYLKLIYIYSCIFPIIHEKAIKDLTSNTTITFGQILHLDQTMQDKGRVFLHAREENDPELIIRKIDDFMKHLLERNEYKQYRKFPASNNEIVISNS